MVTVDFFLDDRLYEIYQRQAQARGISSEEHIKRVLTEMADRYERKAADPGKDAQA